MDETTIHQPQSRFSAHFVRLPISISPLYSRIYVGTVYKSFEQELATWARKYANSPADELIALCLLALEREELVAIGYRENLIRRRLTTMPVSDDVRELIEHALLWVWKDEEMHTIYIRGAIFKLGNWFLRARAFGRQLGGAIAGWSSSIRQHVPWSTAPLSRAAAISLTSIGSLLGKVPEEVRAHLSYGPFRNFCLFNVDAEKTAWLCWSRMAEVAANIPALPPNTVSEFRRVEADEDRHARVFQILSAALDENDSLVPTESAESLVQKIGEVGEFFLPRRMRSQSIGRNPLGSGGQVWSIEGKNAAEKLSQFRKLLDDCQLASRIRIRSDQSGKSLQDLKIAIKPTFMLGYDRRDTSIITDPELLEALAGYLREAGCNDIAVIEARNIYDQFFHGRTVREVASYFGILSSRYRLVDGSEEQVPHSYFRGMAQYSVARTWKEADFRISFGKIRSHPVELVYLTVGNVEWMGGRCDEFIFAERQAQRETAIMMLLDEFPPHFALLDGYASAADGLVGVMGCPRPQHPLRFYAGPDALAVDMVAARHLHMRNPRESSILRAACHWFGDPGGHIEVIGCDEPLKAWKDPYHNDLSAMLSFLAFPVYVFGSGRGSMFLPPMDETAFPPIRRESPTEWIGRRTMRLLLGLGRPK